MLRNSSFNYGNDILMYNINNFVHVSIETLKIIITVSRRA